MQPLNIPGVPRFPGTSPRDPIPGTSPRDPIPGTSPHKIKNWMTDKGKRDRYICSSLLQIKLNCNMNPGYVKTIHNDVYPAIDARGALKGVFTGNVFITGASRGIGRAMAIAFAHAGAKTIGLGARTASDLEETANMARKARPDVNVITYSLDVSKPESVESVWAKIVKDIGMIDVLLNNSGAVSTRLPVADLDPADFWQAFEVNVFGTFLMARQFVKYASPNGTIINTSSIVSRIPVNSNSASYYASKTAVNKFGEALQVDYPTLRIFSIHPGVVETKLARESIAAERIKLICKDTVNLAAGFTVWLTTKAANPAKGGFLAANWDVDELVEYWKSGKPTQIRTVPNWEM